VRASVAYKGSWVRRTRTFVRNGADARADAWFEGVIHGLEAGKPLGAQLAARTVDLSGAALKSWMAESCIGSYPLAETGSSRLPGSGVPAGGSFLVLTVALMLDGDPWIGGAPLIVGKTSL
jgi:hypothetical protein